MKQCGTCKETKESTEFYKSARTGLQYNCKQCNNKLTDKWKKENPGSHLMRIYGISREKKQEMISTQNDSCAICREKFVSGKYTDVDHCHTTNKIRGILCRNCNTGLGQFKDSPKLLQRAIHYIEYHAKQNTTTPVPEGPHIPGAVGAELGSISTPWAWQDSHDLDHHQRAVRGDDADYRAQARGGDGVGYGSEKVGPPKEPKGSQDNGDAETKTGGPTFASRHLFS
jgi:hypothetical protein